MSPASLSRRATLTAIALGLSGCSFEKPNQPNAAQPDSDISLASRAAGDIEHVLAQPIPAALATLLQAHLGKLRAAIPKGSAMPQGQTASPTNAKSLHSALLSYIPQARSGQLALLLCSMAAALDQQQFRGPNRTLSPITSQDTVMGPVAALQTTLAAEHAAIYVLSACAAQTSRSKDRAGWRSFDQAVSAHIRQRDALSLALGADRVLTEPAYALPEMNGPRGVDTAAHSAERACATTYGAQLAATPGDQRLWAEGALRLSAVRQLMLRGSPETFPGIA
ncbi:MAG: DUF4439 domain-containing protein [Marmoricola sp.]